MLLSPPDIPAEYVDRLIRDIKARYDVDFSGYNRNFLRRRIASRMNRTGIRSPALYHRFIMSNPAELSQLLQNLTINVSEFMRNPEVFERLERFVLPRLAERASPRPIRVWTAGCSRGEEPYSIAIIARKLGIAEGPGVFVLATDIDEFALRLAKAGIYDSSSLKNLQPADIIRFFERLGDGRFAVKPEVKRLVVFRKHDVVSGPDIGRFDLIVCRNVSIYFTRRFQEAMYRRFFRDLLDGGYLIIGKTELPPTRIGRLFVEVDLENRIYQKAG